MAQSFNIDFTLKSPKAYSLSVTKSTEGGVSAEYVSEKISEHNVSDTAHKNRFSAYDLTLAGIEERTTTLENNQSELGDQVQEIQGDVTTLKTVVDEKADKATTLSGYGITDAYTKTETNALLAEKADKETTYTKTEVDAMIPETVDAYTKTETDSFLEGKADKATTLSGYGIADGVTLTGAEEISNKTISNSTIKGELSLVGEEPGASFSVSFTGNTPVLASNDGLEVASNTLFDSVPSVKSDPGYSDLISSNIVTKKATAQAVSEHNQDTSAHEDIREKTEEALTIAKKANIAKAYSSYESLVSDLNLEVDKTFSVGQSVYIETMDVPDLWVKSIEETLEPYSYTSDSQFIEDVSVGTQVGFYKLAFLETQKVDLSNYAEKSTTLSGYGITDAYTKTEVDALIPEPVDAYTKTETNALLASKQNTLTAGNGITIEDNVISATAGGSNLSALDDVTITDPTDGQVLTYNATDGVWENTTSTSLTNTATGSEGALAIGDSSTGSGRRSTAIGASSSASGPNTVAIGGGATASGSAAVVVGANASAEPNYTVAVGAGAIVSNGGDCAFGNGAYAQATDAQAFGNGAKALSSNSIAIGYKAQTSGSGLVAIGHNSAASAMNAMAFGYGASASGAGSLAVGQVTASGSGAIAIGGGNKAGGSNSISVGGNIKNTSGQYSLRIGYNARQVSTYDLTGNYGIGIGYNAYTQNQYGIAIGANASVKADYGIQLGRGSNSDANTFKVGLSDTLNVELLSADGTIPAERLVNAPSGGGLSNNSTDDRSLSVGEGATASDPTGTASSGSTAFGYEASANHKASTALGAHSSVSDSSGTAVGSLAESGGSGVAVGWQAFAHDHCVSIGHNAASQNGSMYGTAVGYSSFTSDNYCVALGSEANAYGVGSIAIGSSASALDSSYDDDDTANTIVIGHNASSGKGCITIGEAANTASLPSFPEDGGEPTFLSGENAIAIGKYAQAAGKNTIQLGTGENTDAGTFKVCLGESDTNYMLLDADGKIPAERMSVLSGDSAPTSTTVGVLGQTYIDTATSTAYMCVGADTVTPTYTWSEFGAGGGETIDAYTKTETNSLLSGKADKATTLSGYGITDAYTKTETDALLDEKADKATTVSVSSGNLPPDNMTSGNPGDIYIEILGEVAPYTYVPYICTNYDIETGETTWAKILSNNYAPGSYVDDFVVAASGSEYTALSDGFVWATRDDSQGWVQLRNKNTLLSTGTVISNYGSLFLPVSAGDKFTLEYYEGSVATLKMVCSKGEGA